VLKREPYPAPPLPHNSPARHVAGQTEPPTNGGFRPSLLRTLQPGDRNHIVKEPVPNTWQPSVGEVIAANKPPVNSALKKTRIV